jgi:hypothetical protein
MRELANSKRIEQFMRELGRAVRVDGRVYLTGGATAVLYGWRDTTIDVDIKLIPDHDEILQEIPRLKEALNLNVELAAPSDFIPETFVPSFRPGCPGTLKGGAGT